MRIFLGGSFPTRSFPLLRSFSHDSTCVVISPNSICSFLIRSHLPTASDAFRHPRSFHHVPKGKNEKAVSTILLETKYNSHMNKKLSKLKINIPHPNPRNA